MKKSKKLSLQSLALVLMSFILVAGVAFGMTGAWFTDVESGSNEVIQMGDGVRLAGIDLSSPVISGTRNGQSKDDIAVDAVMPGDTIVLTFDIKKADADSSDFKARLTVTVSYNGVPVDAEKISYTQKLDGQAYTNGTVTETIVDTTGKEVELKFVLHGEKFKNEDALKLFKVEVTVEAIQDANYAEGNWSSYDVVSNGEQWS